MRSGLRRSSETAGAPAEAARWSRLRPALLLRASCGRERYAGARALSRAGKVNLAQVFTLSFGAVDQRWLIERRRF
jgi:hypothetical protein